MGEVSSSLSQICVVTLLIDHYIAMVYTCCVPECRTGYKKRKDESADVEKVAVFTFPRDGNLRSKWIRSIPRKNLVITSSTKVCAKHFYEDDFEHHSTDLFVSSAPVPRTCLHQLFNGNNIVSVTELCNILALCKSLADTSNSSTNVHESYIDLACALLRRFINEDKDNVTTDISVDALLHFIIEQLELCQLAKSTRNYSPTTMTMSFL